MKEDLGSALNKDDDSFRAAASSKSRHSPESSIGSITVDVDLRRYCGCGCANKTIGSNTVDVDVRHYCGCGCAQALRMSYVEVDVDVYQRWWLVKWMVIRGWRNAYSSSKLG